MKKEGKERSSFQFSLQQLWVQNYLLRYFMITKKSFYYNLLGGEEGANIIYKVTCYTLVIKTSFCYNLFLLIIQTINQKFIFFLFDTESL